MESFIQNNIMVKLSAIHGYGVFATQTIPQDDIIETCYCIFTDYNDPQLKNFYFSYHHKKVIPTGFGFIYNHSNTPNAIYYFDETKNRMIIKAQKTIHAHEEILISYGREWFSQRKISIKKAATKIKFINYLKGIPLRISIVITGIFLFIHLMHVSIVPSLAQKTPENLIKTILPMINEKTSNLVPNTPYHLSILASVHP